jgi:hypothetical protein
MQHYTVLVIQEFQDVHAMDEIQAQRQVEDLMITGGRSQRTSFFVGQHSVRQSE